MKRKRRLSKRQWVTGGILALLLIGAIVGPEDVRSRLLTAALGLLAGM